MGLVVVAVVFVTLVSQILVRNLFIVSNLLELKFYFSSKQNRELVITGTKILVPNSFIFSIHSTLTQSPVLINHRFVKWMIYKMHSLEVRSNYLPYKSIYFPPNVKRLIKQ